MMATMALLEDTVMSQWLAGPPGPPFDRTQLLKDLGIYIAVWTGIFLLLRFVLLRARTYDFCNRAVSICHVVAAVILSMRSVEDPLDPLAKVGGPNSPKQMLALNVSLGYFIYDFFGCFFDLKIDVPNAIHHIFSILGLAFGLWRERCGTELIACLWLMELSSPCMHSRIFLKELGYKDTTLSLVNEVIFALVFTFARMVVGPVVVAATLTSNSALGVKQELQVRLQQEQALLAELERQEAAELEAATDASRSEYLLEQLTKAM
ncbi:hypothetical protein CBR_g32335 [Chara braunii]|uniref:TLC domain-containing protein n=1 Tax=Chara braunii TaxID=69332 RepID=A0A388JNJ4_CHABU|nr:hypothetical protein CBR_g32335 [Chara braunii]|eukprot:GBG59323.1 hypothetical protein CBR_g32335 [Chara braunii]